MMDILDALVVILLFNSQRSLQDELLRQGIVQGESNDKSIDCAGAAFTRADCLHLGRPGLRRPRLWLSRRETQRPRRVPVGSRTTRRLGPLAATAVHCVFLVHGSLGSSC